MRELISVFLVLVCFSSLVFSQPKVTIVKKSASALSVGQYDSKGNFSTGDVTLRFAIEPKVTFYEGELSLRAGYNTNESNFVGFWYDQTLTDATSVRVGYFGRPIGFLNRPHPASASAHFETSGTNQIPGGASAIMLTTKFNSTAVYYGLYYNQQKRMSEMSIGISGKVGETNLQGGMFANNSQYGVAATVKNSLFSTTGYYESEKVSSGCLEIYTPIIDPYFVIAYDRNKNIETDLEIGFTKSFSLDSYQKGANYLLGAGYNTVSKTANIYLWVYIE
ncbi:MAG: hypothetical protein WC842_00060 [Candidatus Paceibacterota bacterium]|jgi:hypothetical protein